MYKKSNLAANAILNTLKTVLGIVFPLISYPYISRVLGVDQIGIYNFSASIISYFLLIAALGIPTYAIREGTQYRNDKNKMSKFTSQVFSINVFSTILSYAVLFLLLIFINFFDKYRFGILILSLEIVFTTLGVSWICNIYEDFLFITIRTLIFQIISLIAMFAFVHSEGDLYKYIAIVTFANSGANILNFFYVRKNYCKFYFIFNCNWKQHLKPILVIFSTTVAVTIYVSSDTTMLGFMTSDYQVGLYGTSTKIYTIIKNVLAALVMVLIPRFSLLFSDKQKEKINKLFSSVFNILTVLLLPVSVGLFMMSKDVILVISGAQYVNASNSLKLLSIATIFSLYAYLYTQCILIPLKKENVVFKATLISAIVNVVLNFIFIPWMGIDGAAITTIIAELLTFLISAFYSKNYVKLCNIKKNMSSVIIGCIFIVIICLTCRNFDNLLIRIILSVFGSAVIYFLFLSLTRNPALLDIKHLIKKQ